MKKQLYLLIFLLLATCTSLSAQDIMERFYQPSKDWQEIPHPDHDLHTVKVGPDTISYLVLNPRKKAKGTVIHFHGAGGNISRYTPMTQPLVEAGYRVFMIDFRGYGHSTGKPDHTNVARDAQLLFDQIRKRRDVRKTDIILYGASLGTQVASKIALDNPNKISGLVLDGPMTSFTDIALEYTEEKDKGYVKIFVRSPYSAIASVPELKKVPLLVIHSPQDESIPYHMGEAVYNAKQGPKELWKYDGQHLEAPLLFPAELTSRIDGMVN